MALDLAEGYTVEEASKRNYVSRRSIDRWKSDAEFAAEVSRLAQMIGIAQKAERIMIVKRVVRQQMKEQINKETGEIETIVHTRKDLLDWLRFAKSETEGIKLDLTGLLAAARQKKSLVLAQFWKVDEPTSTITGYAFQGSTPVLVRVDHP
jgi:hypothetical protein